MNFDWSTFLFQTANFAVLVWLLHRFLYRPVLRMVDERRNEIDKSIADVAAQQLKAKKELAALELQHENILRERDAALKDAAEEAEIACKVRIARAERDCTSLAEHARKTLAEERSQALADVTRLAGELGTTIAEHLLAETPLEVRVAFWLDRIARNLAALPAREREELAHEIGDRQPLRVVTPLTLAPAEAERWRNRLATILANDATIRFEADPTLAAGAELHFPNAVLRFSWKGELERIRNEILSHADHP